MSARRWVGIAGTVGALATSAGRAGANPADIFGLGARAGGMAGAQVAAVDDGTATYYNPARLALGDDIHLDVGYQVAQPRVQTDGETLVVDRAEGLVADLAVPGRVLGRRVAVGAGLYLPDQYVTRSRTIAGERPRFLAYDNRPQRLFFAATAAVELRPGLAIGAGIAYMSGTRGSVDLRGLVGFPDPAVSQLELDIDVDLKTIRYPHAGVSWQATPWLTVAAAYRGAFVLKIDQGFTVRGDVGLPDVAPVVAGGFLALRTLSQDLFQPMQVTAGLAAQLGPRWLLAFDAGFQRWSTFENPAARVELQLDIGELNEFVDIPPQPTLPTPRLHDILVPRLGLEYLARGGGHPLRLRAGYAFEPKVAPPQWGSSNFIDNDKHTLAIGGGVDWPGLGGVILKPLSLDLHLALTYLTPRDHVKLSPIDPIGDYRSSGLAVAGSVTSRWRF
ncbi:MAG: outer membrane protein transport protein [Kofleriaceae bacterium]|nr:outer membrane protein transport protein [Kofleriaceae bacterium]